MQIGLDIVHVNRFTDHTGEDDPLLRRIFTEQELALVPPGPRRALRLAGRWAAKEAVAKALGCGFGEQLTFREVVILRNDKGAPTVRLTDAAAARHNHPTLQVSITHDGDYAAAVAVCV
ncbi:holo-ACP synthase [bacterium]|nr:holo-ACP synthase [bacterium]